jgi:hypothetical protein
MMWNFDLVLKQVFGYKSEGGNMPFTRDGSRPGKMGFLRNWILDLMFPFPNDLEL